MQCKLVSTFKTLAYSTEDIAVTPDDKRLIVGSQDSYRHTLLHDPNDGKVLQSFKNTCGYNTYIVKLSADASVVVTKCRDVAYIWDTTTGQIRRQINGQFDCLFLTNDGKIMVTLSRDKRLRTWDVATGKQIKNIRAYDKDMHHVARLAITADGKSAVTADRLGLIRVWDLTKGKMVTEIKVHGMYCMVFITPDGEHIAVGHDNGIDIREANTGKLINTLGPIPFSPYLKQIYITKNKDFVIFHAAYLHIWDIKANKLVCTMKRSDYHFFHMACTEKRVYMSGINGEIAVYAYWHMKEVWEILMGFVFPNGMAGRPMRLISDFVGFSVDSSQLQL